MIELWQSFLRAFLHDPLAVKRWVRGSLHAGAYVAAQIIIDPAWQTWTLKQWVVHAIPAVVAFAAGSVTAGEKNKPDTTAVKP